MEYIYTYTDIGSAHTLRHFKTEVEPLFKEFTKSFIVQLGKLVTDGTVHFFFSRSSPETQLHRTRHRIFLQLLGIIFKYKAAFFAVLYLIYNICICTVRQVICAVNRVCGLCIELILLYSHFYTHVQIYYICHGTWHSVSQ